MVKKYSLCSGNNFNFTLLSYNFFNQYVYLDEDNYPAGPLADFFYKNILFTDPSKVKEGCKFIYTSKSSHYNKDNGTFSGPIGIIGRSEADLYPKPEDYLPIEKFNFVDHTDVIGSFTYMPSMVVEDKINQNNINALFHFLIPSINFFLISIFTILIYFVFMFFILRLKNLKSKYLIIISLSFLFSIILFLINNLYNSSLSTSDVIVDTNGIIDSLDDILNTEREICFLENGSEMEYFRKAKKDSFAYRVYEKRNKLSTCYYFDDSNIGASFLKKDFNKIFFLIPDKGIETGARFIESILRKNIFIGQKISNFESSRTLIMNKAMSRDKKEYVNKLVHIYMEFGFSHKIFRDVPIDITDYKFAKRGGPDGFMTFFSLLDYIEENTKIKPLSFDRLKMMFLIYFGILILILIIYLAYQIFVLIHYLLFITNIYLKRVI